jgi:F0F1-type ATP synthase membrane subunit c/vacuolar-type H+-ATPase subunit K
MYSPEVRGDAGLEVRLRTLRILWAVFLVTVGLYALVAYLANPMSDVERARIQGDPAPNGVPVALLVLFAAGVAAVVASFVLKQAFARKAAAGQRPGLFQQGLILAFVFCEVAALLGLLGLFMTGNRYAYALLALGALGIALHFPRWEQLLAAYFKPVG